MERSLKCCYAIDFDRSYRYNLIYSAYIKFVGSKDSIDSSPPTIRVVYNAREVVSCSTGELCIAVKLYRAFANNVDGTSVQILFGKKLF